MHVNDGLGMIQLHIQVFIIVWVRKVAISEAEQVNFNRLANKATTFICRDYKFMDLMDTI